MKSIFLSGGSGFIGKNLVKVLEKKYNIFNYDLVNGDDTRDEFKLYKLFSTENFDTVIHLAARAGVRSGEDYPEEYISTNVMGTHNIIKMCEKFGVNNLIFFSSSSVLGGNRSVSADGSEVGKFMPLVEEDNYRATSIYAQTKVMGEQMVLSSKVEKKIVIRPFTVFGKDYARKDQVIFKWINLIKSNKAIDIYGENNDTIRGYTFVEDLAQGINKLLDKIDSIKSGEIFHLGGCEQIKLGQIVAVFKEYCESKKIPFSFVNKPLPSTDCFSSFTSTAKARRDFGFDPKENFINNLREILRKEL